MPHFFAVSHHHACPPPPRGGGWHLVLRTLQRQMRVPHFFPCLTMHAPPPGGDGTWCYGECRGKCECLIFSVSHHHACPPPPRGVGDVVASFQAVAAMGSVASHAAHGSHGLLGGLRVSRLQAGLSFFFLAPHLPSKRWQPWAAWLATLPMAATRNSDVFAFEGYTG